MMIYIIVKGNYIEYGGILPYGDTVMTDEQWQERTKNLLKAEIKRRGLGYKELAEALKKVGVKGESDRNLANKLARGSFSAVFLLQVLTAIGCDTLRIEV
jgi:hypothetical protein